MTSDDFGLFLTYLPQDLTSDYAETSLCTVPFDIFRIVICHNFFTINSENARGSVQNVSLDNEIEIPKKLNLKMNKWY